MREILIDWLFGTFNSNGANVSGVYKPRRQRVRVCSVSNTFPGVVLLSTSVAECSKLLSARIPLILQIFTKKIINFRFESILVRC